MCVTLEGGQIVLIAYSGWSKCITRTAFEGMKMRGYESRKRYNTCIIKFPLMSLA